ncbi:MAG: hypothetical protein HRT91_02985 [Piscirickettsiaceae bacterium]|nr:hypothetical protein [Piscirickettsiaceae bacterium]
MCKQQLFVQIFINFLLLAFSFNACSKQWYHVELLVFEHTNTLINEQWPQIKYLKKLPSISNMAVRLIQPAMNKSLVVAEQRLDYSPDYQVYYHQSWRQPVLRKVFAQVITVQSKDALINGNICFYRENYLHVQLDIRLIRNIKLANIWSGTLPQNTHISATRTPNLRESRRIYSNKLHFFDHPKLGALIQLTPIDTPMVVLDGE